MPQLPGRQSWDWMAWPRGKIERMARAASVNVSTTLATGHDMQNMQATPQSNMAGPIQAAGRNAVSCTPKNLRTSRGSGISELIF